MPVPNRLRAYLGRRRRSELEQEAQQVSLDAPAQARDQGMVRRFLSRMREEDSPAPTEKRTELGPAGRLERFLNLGDDLPPASAGQRLEELSPPPPRPSRANPPPVASSIQPPAPSKPAAVRTERPFKPAQLPDSPPAPIRDISEFAPEQGNDVTERTWPDTTAVPAREDAAPHKGGEPEAFDEAPDLEEATTEEDEILAAAVSASESEATKAEVEPSAIEPEDVFEPTPVSAAEKPRPRIDWSMPDYQAVLNRGTASELDQETLLQQAQIIEDTLASFGAPGRVVEINSGTRNHAIRRGAGIFDRQDRQAQSRQGRRYRQVGQRPAVGCWAPARCVWKRPCPARVMWA